MVKTNANKSYFTIFIENHIFFFFCWNGTFLECFMAFLFFTKKQQITLCVSAGIFLYFDREVPFTSRCRELLVGFVMFFLTSK